MGGSDGEDGQQLQSLERPATERDRLPNPTMIIRKRQIIFLVIEFVSIFAEIRGRQLTPLVCNSVNDLQEINVQTDLVYVTTRGRECTFVFEGPPGSQLDIKVHSFSTEGSAKSNCKNPPVRLFTYNVKNKLRQYEKVLCAEDDAVRTVTDGNTALITSNLHYGSFFVRVKPISSLIDPRLREKTKRISNFISQQQRKPHLGARRRNDLIKFTSEAAEQTDIDGMFPPNLQSIDFFAMLNQFEIPVRFRAQPQGFTPSYYYPSSGNPRPTDSYGAPVTSGPILWGIYPGSPGVDISITSTQNPTEWIGSQSSIVSGSGHPGYPDARPATSTPQSVTDKVSEVTTAPTPTRYTEPLTNPTSTVAPLSSSAAPQLSSAAPQPTSAAPPPASSAEPEKSVENASNESTSTSITNTTITTETITESEQQKMVKSQIATNSEGFKPMLVQ